MRYTPDALPLFVAAVITVGLVIYVWQQYRSGIVVRGATAFAWAMFSIAGWAACHGFEILAVGLPAKVLWGQITYVFVVSTPVFLWAFSAQYSGHENWVTSRNLVLLFIFPIITLLFVFINPDQLFWSSISIGALDVNVEHGPAFWFHAAYAYSLILISLGMLLRTMFESASQYRWQVGLLAVGILAPVILNVIYIFTNASGGDTFFNSRDLTPVAFTITGLILAWDLYRFGLLNLAPVARDVVVENMRDGMFVLDNQNRIIDLNPAAMRILGIQRKDNLIIGKPAAQVLNTWPNMLERYRTTKFAQSEIELPVESEKRDFDLLISSLTDRKGRITGRLILLHDITERKRAEAELQAAKAMAEAEHEKSESLLLNILPRDIAALLKRGDAVIAEHFDSASILFADLVNFTPFSAQLSPDELIGLLNEIFSYFDQLVDHYGLEKIKTIGDCYMVASGVPVSRADHAQALARLALDIQAYMASRQFLGHSLQFRIGINSGPVVAGVIGRKKFIYDLWGDTVNMASRMESHGIGGCIQITEATYRLIADEFACEPKGLVNIKGKGEMPVWHVKGFK
jgi:PAS domain S-box-containing protein